MLIKLSKNKGELKISEVKVDKILKCSSRKIVEVLYFKKVANEVLKKECFVNKDTGRYESTIYVDYRDEIPTDIIKKILACKTSEQKMDMFHEYIYEAYCESEESIFEYIIKDIQKELEFMNMDYTDIRDYIVDMVDIEYPHEEFLKTKVNANLIVDTGDGESDFILNTASYMEDNIDDESSIKWLVNQQGYSTEELQKVLFDEDYEIKDVFMKSIYQELIDTTSSMNALTFLIDTTLEELINFDLDKIESVTVSKNSNCGLIDYWNGAGGSLSINLKEDVVIPKKFIDSFTIDGNRGRYGIDSIYGMSEDEWNGTISINYK